jgi:hypothetical protein
MCIVHAKGPINQQNKLRPNQWIPFTFNSNVRAKLTLPHICVSLAYMVAYFLSSILKGMDRH